jgi:hypothetical protein
LSVGKSLVPELVVQVKLDVFLFEVFVLFDDELVKRIVEDSLEDPLFEDFEVWLGAFF